MKITSPYPNHILYPESLLPGLEEFRDRTSEEMSSEEEFDEPPNPRRITMAKRRPSLNQPQASPGRSSPGKSTNPFLTAARQMGDLWEEAREAKGQSPFEIPEIDDGSYYAVVTMSSEIRQKGFAKGGFGSDIVFTITDDEGQEQFAGLEITSRFDFPPGPKFKDRRDGTLKSLVGTLKRILPDCEQDLEASDNLADLEAFQNELNERRPLVTVDITNGTSQSGTKYLNTRVKEVHENSEAAVEQENGSAQEEPESESEGEGAGVAPAQGEWYDYRPPRKRKSIACQVMTVNQSKGTVTLEDEEGNKYSSVAWPDLGNQLDD